ncbi:hypothetical protein [Brevundimonas sp.]|uniref:hypothetical protein n=1 Tax=Brevundimonas sp. TaxID=1871086 RepID=UPI0025BC02BC|nr:hypothetical protein [Brevundimonas sp.]
MDPEQQMPPKGASLEDRAAKALNAVMIMLLSAAAAAFGAWMSFIYIQRALARGLDFTWTEIMASGQILSGLFVFVLACFGMRFGFRMLFKTSAPG